MTQTGVETRVIAFRLLDSVLRRNTPLDDALNRIDGYGRLSDRDRSFVRNLVATTLRRLGQIDALIDHCLDRPLSGKAKPVGHILRLGVAQLLFLETPDHAAVDTAVAAAGRLGFTTHRKLVNALLRRLAPEGETLKNAQDAERLNTPDWLWASWRGAYGDDTCRRIARAHLIEAPLDISVKSDLRQWAEALGGALLPWGTVRRRSPGDVTALPGYSDGQWWVQDGAARAVLDLLGDVRGKTVIDLCAAPGGKTCFLANAGAAVTAVDRSENRLRRLTENLDRLGLRSTVVHADALDWRPRALADMVLLDAPCSATGTIRRHPEIGWLKSPADVAKLQDLQQRLLSSAAEMVRPGGTGLFCTCSLQAEEGPAVVESLVEQGPPLSLERPPALTGEPLAAFAFKARYFRSFPFHLSAEGGMDGFFAARLIRW